MSSATWKELPLSELVADTVGGLWGHSADSSEPDETDVLVVRGADFRNWDVRRAADAAHRRIPARALDRRRLRAGDLVLEVSGGGPGQPVGRVLIVDERAVSEASTPLICSNFCRKLRLEPGVSPLFVKQQLEWLYRSGHMNRFQTSSTNIRNLQVEDLLNGTTISLPGAAIQAEIAYLVDTFEQKRGTAASHLVAARRATERFRRAVLSAACSGRLTEDWRATNATEPASELLSRIRNDVLTARLKSRRKAPSHLDPTPHEVPSSWSWASVSDVCTSVTDGDHQAPPKSASGIPFVVIGNLSSGTLDMRDTRYVPNDYYEQLDETRKAKRGDVLYTVTGSYGLAILVETDNAFSFQRHVALLKPHPSVSGGYLRLSLSTPLAFRQATQVATGIAQLTVALSGLREMRVPVPPAAEQLEIVRRVCALFGLADAVERRIDTAASRALSLSQAVLAKAFRGELGGTGVGDRVEVPA